MVKKEIVVGIDEAGRGALAGPVVSCAFMFNDKADLSANDEIRSTLKDSKQLSEKKREDIRDVLYRTNNVFRTAERDAKYVDCMNVLNATKASATEAFIAVADQYHTYIFPSPDGTVYGGTHHNTDNIDYDKMPTARIKVDGNVPLVDSGVLKNTVQECIVKGDTLIPEIMAASILAKVSRDDTMRSISTTLKERFGGKDPYNLAENKGYGTPQHLEALRLYGPTEFHRKTFKRVREYV